MSARALRLVPFLVASVAIHGALLLAAPERLAIGTVAPGAAHSISIELVPAGRPAERADAPDVGAAVADSRARPVKAEPASADERPEPERALAPAATEGAPEEAEADDDPSEPAPREARGPEQRTPEAAPAGTAAQAPPARERVAEAGPQPPAKARPGPGEAEPAPAGAGAGGEAARTAEAERVRDHIASRLAEHFRYPRLARQRGWEGRVVLAFRVQADGRLSDIRVAESSGRAILDEAAVRALRRVGRVPELGERAGVGPLALELPVTYRLHSA